MRERRPCSPLPCPWGSANLPVHRSDSSSHLTVPQYARQCGIRQGVSVVRQWSFHLWYTRAGSRAGPTTSRGLRRMTALLLAGTAALLVGLSKTGVPGVSLPAILLDGQAFPGAEKMSVAAIMPILLLGDCFAVGYYRQHAQWKRLWSLFPYVLVGMIPGWSRTAVGRRPAVPAGARLDGVGSAGLGTWPARSRLGPHSRAVVVHRSVGVLAGFGTTVGNAAGPVMSIFLISQGMQKEQFMGTWAWFFLIVNLTKVPLLLSLELFSVNMVTPDMLWFDLCVLPLVVLPRSSAGASSTSSPSGSSTRLVLAAGRRGGAADGWCGRHLLTFRSPAYDRWQPGWTLPRSGTIIESYTTRVSIWNVMQSLPRSHEGQCDRHESLVGQLHSFVGLADGWDSYQPAPQSVAITQAKSLESTWRGGPLPIPACSQCCRRHRGHFPSGATEELRRVLQQWDRPRPVFGWRIRADNATRWSQRKTATLVSWQKSGNT